MHHLSRGQESHQTSHSGNCVAIQLIPLTGQETNSPMKTTTHLWIQQNTRNGLQWFFTQIQPLFKMSVNLHVKQNMASMCLLVRFIQVRRFYLVSD